MTRFLDYSAIGLLLAGGWIHFTEPPLAFDLTAVFLIVMGLCLLCLSAVIKDNYLEVVHFVSAGIFAYYVSPLVGILYVGLIFTFKYSRSTQLIVAAIFYSGFLVLLR